MAVDHWKFAVDPFRQLTGNLVSPMGQLTFGLARPMFELSS